MELFCIPNVSGKGIDQNDFNLTYARTSGEVIFNSNGAAFIPHLLRNDNKTEGIEQLTISLYRDKKFKNKVASTTVPVFDTSVQTSEQGPTKSSNPNTKQQQWSGGVLGEAGSHYPQAEVPFNAEKQYQLA